MDFEGLNNINESKSDDLYFISENNMDGKILQPRIPNNYFTKNGYEENQTKRVCFSTSIDKCLMALSMNCKGKEYYVHQPVGEYTIINPTIKDVPDSKITGEKWITSPVKIKCVSKIKVLDDDGKDGKKFNYGENTAELYGWKWEYINESITNENHFISKDDINKKDDDIYNSLKFDKLKNQLESSSIDRLNDLPFFTSEDLESYSNYYTECNENKEWIDMYKLINIGAFSEDFYEINKNRIETLNELYKDYPNFDDYTKQRILNLGWNPEVAFSSKNRRIATENTRLRIKKILNESNVVEEDVILESKSNKKPIYLVFTWTETLFGKGIRAVTKGTYTHACISLDKTLNKLYSYNLVNGISKFGGLSIEDLRTYNPEGSVLVYVTYITEEQLKKLKKVINDLVNNVNKTKYSILNVFGILLNRPIETNHNMVCSQFVDKMMKTIGLDLTNGKNSALVTPVDLYKSASNKIYKVYEGGIKNFKPNKITKSEKNIKVNEAKLPIEFDSEGNLNINKIIDIQEEYNKSHKLLLNYDKSKNYKAMKEELFKLWALNIKLEKIIYKQKKANKSDYDLRARILNDFNKYIKIVSENEEDFNFSKEFDKSIYNNNSYSISKHTLKHGIQYIKSIFL